MSKVFCITLAFVLLLSFSSVCFASTSYNFYCATPTGYDTPILVCPGVAPSGLYEGILYSAGYSYVISPFAIEFNGTDRWSVDVEVSIYSNGEVEFTDFIPITVYYEESLDCMIVSLGVYSEILSLNESSMVITAVEANTSEFSSFVSAVTSVVPLVLSWMGLALTALVSGPLSPLLVTFCVAVAVVVVFLVVRYIKKYK